VKCFTCGTVIGDTYLYYQKRVFDLKKERKINPEVIQYLDETRIDKTVEGEVLDELKLTKLCCRRHMLTHVNIF
jgi:DNA-directed RNA polymerase I, II, and III subunit RPABC5